MAQEQGVVFGQLRRERCLQWSAVRRVDDTVESKGHSGLSDYMGSVLLHTPIRHHYGQRI